jgi:hypothetical protein
MKITLIFLLPSALVLFLFGCAMPQASGTVWESGWHTTYTPADASIES